MTTFIFVRHGETAWSRTQKHTIRGRIDLPLNDNGLFQAKDVAERLKTDKVAAVYSSALERAFTTAENIASFHKLPVISHPGFIDLDFGDWQGKRHEELIQRYPELYHQWTTAPHTVILPHGETLGTVRNRVEEAINDLADKHKDETIVIVTHGVVLRVILCYLNNVGNEKYWDFDMDNCAITIAKLNLEGFSILLMNGTDHL